MKFSIKTARRLCRAGSACCAVAMLGGIAWLANLCIETISAPVDFTILWLIWQVAQMLFAMALIYSADSLNNELIYAIQELESAAYKEALYNGLIPQDRRRGA